MRVLLISTYELGHQPLHLASPAGRLEREGHEVRCADLAVDPLADADVDWADAVACSVPMHTATRLALAVCERVRRRRGRLPLCLYGLYAELGAPFVELALAGEYEPGLVEWVAGLARPGGGDAPEPARRPGGTVVALGRTAFGLPARHLLPPLERYARLIAGGETHLAGYVEASHGCNHSCSHCPVPVVYGGRSRPVDEEVVLADIGRLVELGARHITFGDPDFLNRPHHSRRIAAALHLAYPEITFDVTVKVEHVLEHDGLWTELAASGCLFVVSAFESASDQILGRLQKGHTCADEIRAVEVLRDAGIEPRPSLVPFTPWTRPHDVVELLDLAARADLVGNVDPVQYAIRLLVPPGSLLVTSGELDGVLGGYDDEHLTWRWSAVDGALDQLQHELARVAEQAAAESWPAKESYRSIRATVVDSLQLGADLRPAPEPLATLRSPLPPDDRPRLSEAWFCCAEPTEAQFGALQGAGGG